MDQSELLDVDADADADDGENVGEEENEGEEDIAGAGELVNELSDMTIDNGELLPAVDAADAAAA